MPGVGGHWNHHIYSNMDRTTHGMWLSQDPWRAPTLSVPQILDCGVVSHFPSKPDEGVFVKGIQGGGWRCS